MRKRLAVTRFADCFPVAALSELIKVNWPGPSSPRPIAWPLRPSAEHETKMHVPAF